MVPAAHNSGSLPRQPFMMSRTGWAAWKLRLDKQTANHKTRTRERESKSRLCSFDPANQTGGTGVERLNLSCLKLFLICWESCDSLGIHVSCRVQHIYMAVLSAVFYYCVPYFIPYYLYTQSQRNYRVEYTTTSLSALPWVVGPWFP